MVGISIHNETDYALTEAMTQEILEPTASGAEGLLCSPEASP